jgi:hypothetical protein
MTGFFSDEITWRGLAYRVKNGRLLPLEIPHLKVKSSGPAGALPKIAHQQEHIPARPLLV